MSVDLLICNYNTQPLLKRLLDTLHSDYEAGVWNIYIADNNSSDGSQKWLMDNRYDYHIEEIEFNENVGYAEAINDLSYKCDSEFLCAVNADTWFTTRHVKQIETAFLSNPKAGVIGPKQMDESSRIRHGGIMWTGNSSLEHRGWGQYDPLDVAYKDTMACATVSGSIYYVRRQAWDEMRFDPQFEELFPSAKGAFLPTPMYFEETFCSMHAQAKGWHVIYDGTVETAGHTWHASNPVGSNVHYFDISKDIYRQVCRKMKIRNEFDDHLLV